MNLIQPRVPVLGLQKRQVQICGLPIVSAVVLCDCGHGVPVIIPAIDRAGVCVSCKTQYVVAKLDFLNDKGNISLNTEVAKWYGPQDASTELAVMGRPTKADN